MTTLERFLQNHPALNRAGDQSYTAAVWGGIAQEYDALQSELHKITVDAADVNALSGDELDEVILRFIGINRMQGEMDEFRIKLLKALYIREKLPGYVKPDIPDDPAGTVYRNILFSASDGTSSYGDYGKFSVYDFTTTWAEPPIESNCIRIQGYAGHGMILRLFGFDARGKRVIWRVRPSIDAPIGTMFTNADGTLYDQQVAYGAGTWSQFSALFDTSGVGAFVDFELSGGWLGYVDISALYIGDGSYLDTSYGSSWATPHSIKNVFSYWFDRTLINIRENEIETSLITDGTFESYSVGTKTAPFDEWTPSGSSISIDSTETYEGSRVLHGVGTGAVAFTKAVTAKPYILSAAYKGYCPVKVRRSSDSKYWNFSTRAWQTASAQLDLSNAGTEYVVFEAPIIVDGSYNVTVTFGPDGSGRDFRIDLASFGEKPSYPFVHVLVSTFSQSGSYLNNWPAGTDPISGTVYTNATFLGLDFIGGEGTGTPITYYQNILNYIKPAGVKATFGFVGRTL